MSCAACRWEPKCSPTAVCIFAFGRHVPNPWRWRWISRSRNSPEKLQAYPLDAEADGYFSGTVTEAEAGGLYKLRLDSGCFPDPASRFPTRRPAWSIASDRSARVSVDGWELERHRTGRPGDLRNAHRHVHPRRHLERAPWNNCRNWPAGNHYAGSHADRGFSRQIRLGL